MSATTITADPTTPTVEIVREFAAPTTALFRAHVDPELFARWIGPRGLTTVLERWEPNTGGSYRYVASDDDGEYRFYGSFHEVRDNERIVQTFTWEGMPDGVAIETLTFIDLGDNRSRLRVLSVFDSFDARDAMMASGMDVGVNEGHEKLDELLATT